MTLPQNYEWLLKIDAPRVIDEALLLYGTTEIVGPKHNPVILGWAAEVGVSSTYKADEIPWCGLFAAIVVKLAGYEPVAEPLWARNWQRFGNKADRPALGDVLAFKRDSGGHVGFYVAEDASAYHVLGGNQGDQVSIVRIAKARLLSARRCPWKLGQPASVRPYIVAPTGGLSRNEG